MAVFSGSLFMLAPDTSFSNHLELTLDTNWSHYSSLYAAATTCDVDFNKLASADMRWCTSGGQQPQNSTVTVMQYSTND